MPELQKVYQWLFLRNVSSSFNPSKDLPASLEGALLLWVQKVTQAVNEARQLAEAGPPRVAGGSAPRQRRHNRMSRAAKAEGEGVTVLEVTDIAGGLADGQCLAALLLCYAPQEMGWKGARARGVGGGGGGRGGLTWRLGIVYRRLALFLQTDSKKVVGTDD